ncbi:uncharacterized protein LOC121379254 [Gigantopelta aegis]|uniref:uncharacterized protein LOC121379254 n=1 Tax=Gigantopelta aegis TaxID=1735272 RepID=UPI001B889A0D|nr:uncharacterized protein LOC121379254 [Gigantopelta aegis]
MPELKLESYVQEVLNDEIERDDRFLEVEDLEHLLRDENDGEVPRSGIFGYPSSPLYRELANMLQLWMTNRWCPIFDLPKYGLLDETVYVETRAATVASITPLLEGLLTLWELWGREEIKFRIRQVMLLLGKRGLLDILGVRKTVGSTNMWPTSRKKLLASFLEKHSPNSKICVGARALSKHYHRDESTSWWGNCTGTEENKNTHALQIVLKILDHATWINIHWLPHDLFILEVRQAEGYGARWSADGSTFRGFLEPQMIGGHDAGWKH